MRFKKVDSRYLDAAIIRENIEENIGDVRVPVFVVRLRNTRYNKYSSGRAWGCIQITVTLGTDINDMRSVIAHEYAHILNAYHRTGNGHDDAFYRHLFALVKRCGYDVAYTVKREKGYKPRSSQRVARAMRIATKP